MIRMKSISQMAPERIHVRDLIRFVGEAQGALEEKGELDSALRFEILKDFLERDFDPRKGTLKFSGMAIGL